MSARVQTEPALRFAVLLAILLGAFATSHAWAGTADDDYQNAKKLYKAGRWQLATDAFQQFLKDHKQDAKVPFARLYVGIGLENLNKYRDARTVLRAFVKDYPKNANANDALYRVAECSFYLNELKEAEGEFQTFLNAAPKHDFAEYALPYLADTQLRLGKPKPAAANFQKSLNQYANGRMVDVSKLGLARCHIQLKQTDDGIKLLKELAAQPAAALAPDAQTELATLYFDLGRFTDSAKAFDEFAERFKDKKDRVPRAHLDAGFAYYRAEDYKTAAARFQTAAGSAKLALDANYWRGMSYKAAGDFPQAIAVLSGQFQRDSKSPLAADVLYGWAACERLSGKHADTHTRYLDFVKRFPKHANADDALHFAAEAAFEAEWLDDAQTALDRFRKEYPKSPLWPSQGILQGRVSTARGGKTDLVAAAKTLKQVIDESRVPATQFLARFYLAQTLRLQKNHKLALETLEPLLKSVEKDGAKSRFVNAVILAGRSAAALKQDERAVKLMTRFLELQPQGDQTVVALTTRLSSAARLGRKPQVRDDIATLAKSHAADPSFQQAFHTIAEDAYKSQDWKWAIELFTQLETLSRKTKLHPSVLSGLAWSQFESKSYAASAATFARVVREYPEDAVLAPQSAYKQAESLGKSGKTEESAKLYDAAFDQFAPKKTAAVGSEKMGQPLYYTYRAGLAAARTWAKLKKVAEADAAYEKLLARFPRPESLDKRLDEWALLNYNAGLYKRSDEIFRRLVAEAPKSDLVDNARYSLAESDLNAGKLEAARKVMAELAVDKNSDELVKEVSLYRLIGIGIQQEQWKAVRDLGDQFATAFPKSRHEPYAQFSSAEARVRLKDLKTARKTLKTLEQLPKTSAAVTAEWYPRVWILLAEIAYSGREYDVVSKTVATMRQKFPKAELLYQADEVLGRSFKKQALFDKAREAFGRVVSHPQGKKTEMGAKSQYMIADTYLMQDNYKQAQPAFLRVDNLFQFPVWQAPALLYAGHCAEKLNDFRGAETSYQQLIKQFAGTSAAKQAKPRLKIVQQRLKVGG